MKLDGIAQFMRTSDTSLNVEFWFDLDGDESAEVIGYFVDQIEELVREKAKEL